MSVIVEEHESHDGIEFVLRVKRGAQQLGWQWSVCVMDAGQLLHAYGPISFLPPQAQSATVRSQAGSDPDALRISDGLNRARRWIKRHFNEYSWVRERQSQEDGGVASDREYGEELAGINFIYRVNGGVDCQGWKWSVSSVQNGREVLLYGPVSFVTELAMLQDEAGLLASPTDDERFVDGFRRAQAWAQNSMIRHAAADS